MVTSAPNLRSASTRSLWNELKGLLARLHFYVGLFIAPFLLIAAVTGILYALTPQIESVVYDKQLSVSAPAGARLAPLSEQVQAAQAAVPDGTVAEVRPAQDSTSTTRVSFETSAAAADRRMTAFVNPYTSEVTGVLETYGEWLPIRTWFDDLHRNLHLGEVGRVYSELAASWLWVLAASGLVLWLTRRMRRRSVRAYLLPARTGPHRKRTLSVHATLGVWASLGLFFLAATGLTWSSFSGGNIEKLREALSWTTPSVAVEASDAGPVAQSDVPEVAQSMMATAAANGLDSPIAIIPAAEDGAWKVSQVQRSWPSKQDSIAVDPTNLRVLEKIEFDDWPLAAKLARWGVDAHMGLLFGWVNQIVLIALALALVGVILAGYRMWWLRRPKAPKRCLPAPLGASSSSTMAYALLLATAAVLGVLVPVLGVSLVIFILADLARRALGRMPHRTAPRR